MEKENIHFFLRSCDIGVVPSHDAIYEAAGWLVLKMSCTTMPLSLSILLQDLNIQVIMALFIILYLTNNKSLLV